jgi:hypothetical protein
MRTVIFALALGLLPAAWSGSLAQDNIDLSGMDCAEQALTLRNIVENNEPNEDEADRLDMEITNAQAACRNEDEQALAEIARDLEGREWNLDADALESN